jgi:hypothetical protein
MLGFLWEWSLEGGLIKQFVEAVDVGGFVKIKTIGRSLTLLDCPESYRKNRSGLINHL